MPTIKNEATELVASHAAAKTGESLNAEIEDLLHRVDALPASASRHESEILGYAEDSIPR